MWNRYSEEKEQEIIRLYVEEGKTQKEIAKVFNTDTRIFRK